MYKVAHILGGVWMLGGDKFGGQTYVTKPPNRLTKEKLIYTKKFNMKKFINFDESCPKISIDSS